MEAACVRAILPLTDLIAMPRARSGLLGAAGVNGRVVNVIDLCKKLHLPPSRPGSQPKIVVFELTVGDSEHWVGFIADRVSGVAKYRASPNANGMLRGQGRPRRLIDFKRLVTEADISAAWVLSP